MSDRLNNFDFLRLFFAILVIVPHSLPLGSGTEAVTCFFIMSGYLIPISYFRSRSPLSFVG